MLFSGENLKSEKRGTFMKSCLYLSMVILLSLFFSGCSDKQDLTGKVTFPDGKPLHCGVVFFTTDSYLSRGAIREDGTFTVGSEKMGDGIPPGTYKVYIQGAIEEELIPEDDSRRAKPSDEFSTSQGAKGFLAPAKLLIHQKYTRRETTPLEIVIPGDRQFNITVEPPN